MTWPEAGGAIPGAWPEAGGAIPGAWPDAGGAIPGASPESGRTFKGSAVQQLISCMYTRLMQSHSWHTQAYLYIPP